WIASSLALLAMTTVSIWIENNKAEAGNRMIPPLKPGAKLLRVDGPIIETERLILRPWRSADIAANTAMLSDPGTARYITPDGVAITTEIGGWRNAAVISGHWALHGFGMFASRKNRAAAISAASGRGAHRAGQVLRSAGGSTAPTAARVMLWKRRGRGSTGTT